MVFYQYSGGTLFITFLYFYTFIPLIWAIFYQITERDPHPPHLKQKCISLYFIIRFLYNIYLIRLYPPHLSQPHILPFILSILIPFPPPLPAFLDKFLHYCILLWHVESNNREPNPSPPPPHPPSSIYSNLFHYYILI